MDKLVEISDDIKNNIPEGTYLEMMNALMEVKKQLPNPEHPGHDNILETLDTFEGELLSLHWSMMEVECHQQLIRKLLLMLRLQKQRMHGLMNGICDLAVAQSQLSHNLREQPLLDLVIEHQ